MAVVRPQRDGADANCRISAGACNGATRRGLTTASQRGTVSSHCGGDGCTSAATAAGANGADADADGRCARSHASESHRRCDANAAGCAFDDNFFDDTDPSLASAVDANPSSTQPANPHLQRIFRTTSSPLRAPDHRGRVRLLARFTIVRPAIIEVAVIFPNASR